MPDDTPRLPPLKTDPKLGYFPWWPENGDDWVHPEDVATARSMIPSPRIWRRDGVVPSDRESASNAYVVMHYGERRLRVRRTLWREVLDEGFELGDWVEVRPRGLVNEPHTGRIRERHWDEHAGVVIYFLILADETRLERSYQAIDLKHVEPPSPSEADARLEPPTGDGSEIGLQPPS